MDNRLDTVFWLHWLSLIGLVECGNHQSGFEVGCVQEVVNAQPQLVQFATQGKPQFAWVDVSFELWRSTKINGQPSAGLETDPTTNQPRIHHMMVLLLHVPQDANGAMGGIGWLVSGYFLDLPSGETLDIAQPA